MSTLPLHDREQNMPAPQGHVIGFAESHSDCVDIFRTLSDMGIPDSGVTLLCGDDGVHLLKRMFGSAQWGEAADDVLEQGVIELGRGHCAIIIDVKDREQALMAADAAIPFGGHGFTYFGIMVDEKLTQ